MISNVSELLNVIAYMTALMLLVDKIQGLLLDLDMPPSRGIVSHYQIPIAARFENADICNTSSGSDTTNIQLFCPKLPQNPLILTKFPFWHPLYTRLFVIVTAVCLFQANCSLFLSTCVYGNGYILCKPLQG